MSSLTEPRAYTGWLYDLTYEFEEGPCFYVGNRQGGPIYDVTDPNDGVIEKIYSDYKVESAFSEENYAFGLFSEDRCAAAEIEVGTTTQTRVEGNVTRTAEAEVVTTNVAEITATIKAEVATTSESGVPPTTTKAEVATTATKSEVAMTTEATVSTTNAAEIDMTNMANVTTMNGEEISMTTQASPLGTTTNALDIKNKDTGNLSICNNYSTQKDEFTKTLMETQTNAKTLTAQMVILTTQMAALTSNIEVLETQNGGTQFQNGGISYYPLQQHLRVTLLLFLL